LVKRIEGKNIMILAILKKESSESNRRFIDLSVFCRLLPANHGPFRGLTKDPGSKPDSRPTEKCGKKPGSGRK